MPNIAGGTLRAALDDPDAGLAARKARLERLLTIRFDPDPAARVAAIESFGADESADLQAVLNPLLTKTRIAAKTLPEGANIAATLTPGADLSETEAYALLVAGGLAPARLSAADQKAALVAHMDAYQAGGVPLANLDSAEARDRAACGPVAPSTGLYLTGVEYAGEAGHKSRETR